ncbi:MAG: CYTH domain-containing protein [Eubacteriales bacterium]|nr:CYTH domain-containing protein [Eubacteriales bacterium]
MEIELKYDLTEQPDASDKIFNDVMIHFLEDGEIEKIPMSAVYYDTDTLDLAKEKIAFRIRNEGGKYVGTLKWNNETAEELSMREEMNIHLPKEAAEGEPDIGIFRESGISDDLIRICGKKKLVPIVTMRFTRSQVRVDTGTSISELSIDFGEIHANGKTAPIHEMELEYFSGDVEDMKKLGKRIAEKFHLRPEIRSKFGRGFALLEMDLEDESGK